MNETPELLPCPSCAHAEVGFGEERLSGFVYCFNCGIRTSGEYTYRYENWKEMAAEEWNTRVYPTEVQAAIDRDTPKKPTFVLSWRCPACKSGLWPESALCPSCGQRLDWSEG